MIRRVFLKALSLLPISLTGIKESTPLEQAFKPQIDKATRFPCLLHYMILNATNDVCIENIEYNGKNKFANLELDTQSEFGKCYYQVAASYLPFPLVRYK